MGVYDQAARYLAKRNPLGFLRWVVPRFLTQFVFLGWLDTTRIAFPGEPDRICDKVAEFAPADGAGPRRILDIEFQAEPDGDIMERLGEYAYRLRRELRFGPGQGGKYRVASVLLNLTGPAQASELDMTEESLDGAGHYLLVVLRTLRDEDAATTLARIASGELDRCVLPWIPLMRGAEVTSIIEEWKRLAEQEPDSQWRSDYAALALVFAELANRRPAWFQALEGWNMQQSQQVLEWQQEALQEGLAKGLQRGEVKGQRDALLSFLEDRFQAPLPADLAKVIAASVDLEEVKRWWKTAARADSLDAFRAAMGNGTAKP